LHVSATEVAYLEARARSLRKRSSKSISARPTIGSSESTQPSNIGLIAVPIEKLSRHVSVRRIAGFQLAAQNWSPTIGPARHRVFDLGRDGPNGMEIHSDRISHIENGEIAARRRA
jgi:hypothetical protein